MLHCHLQINSATRQEQGENIHLFGTYTVSTDFALPVFLFHVNQPPFQRCRQPYFSVQGQQVTYFFNILCKVGFHRQASGPFASYHRFRWYATLENKTPAELFPKLPSILSVINRSDRNPPITSTYGSGSKETTEGHAMDLPIAYHKRSFTNTTVRFLVPTQLKLAIVCPFF